MTKLLQVALNDLRVSLKDRSVWVNLTVIPIFLIFIVGLVNGGASNGGEGDTVLMDVLNQDTSELSASFLDSLRQANPTLVLCPMDNDDEDICGLGDEPLTEARSVERIDNDEVSALLIIPAGFGEAVIDGAPVDVTFRSESDPTQPSPLLQSVQAAVQQVAGASVAAQVGAQVYEQNTGDDAGTFRETVYEDAAQRWENPPSVVTYQVATAEDGETTSGFTQSAPGMGTMYVMFTVLAGAVVILQERGYGTLQRLAVMPLRRWQLLGGKMLARFVLGIIQFAIAFVAGAFFGANFGDDPLALVLVMVSFTLTTTALALVLATFVDREQQANSLTTFLVLVAAPLGGAWWPLEIVPDFMQTLAYISPVGWAMTAFNELMFYDGGLVDVVPSIIVLVAAAVVLFGIGIVRFRYE
jgi:ABC-2 type transport system permease protein